MMQVMTWMSMNINSKTFSIIPSKISNREPTTNILSAIRRVRGSCREMERMHSNRTNMDMAMIMIMAIIVIMCRLRLGRLIHKISICRKAVNNMIKKRHSKIVKRKIVKWVGRVLLQMFWKDRNRLKTLILHIEISYNRWLRILIQMSPVLSLTLSSRILSAIKT